MLASLRKLSDWLNRLIIGLCVLFILIMLSISFIGFFYMIITGAALSWTYSLARLFIPWIGMLSIAVAFKTGEHVAVTMLVRALPAPWSRALQYVTLALIGVFAVLLVWLGWDFFVGSTQYYMVSDQIQIHGRWVAACMPVAGVVLLVHLASGIRLLEPPAEEPDELPAGRTS